MLLALLAPGRADAARAARAPVLADPSVLRYGGRYWVYGTAARNAPGTAAFPILRSRDLRRWTSVSYAFPRGPRWARGQYWAPSVLRYRGRFELFYSALARRGRVHCVARAVSLRARGPFTDRGPLACGDATGRGYIDAAPLVDRTGAAWLYVSVDAPEHSVSVLPLSPDLSRVTGPRRELFRVTERWEDDGTGLTVEAPAPLALPSGAFALFYSANDWRGRYAMGVARGLEPAGPFFKARANPLDLGFPRERGAGGGSAFLDAEGRPWLAHHAWDGPPRDVDRRRRLHVTPLLIAGWAARAVTPGAGPGFAP